MTFSDLGSEYLEHYGVKGMKWRRRKTRNSRGVDTAGYDKNNWEKWNQKARKAGFKDKDLNIPEGYKMSTDKIREMRKRAIEMNKGKNYRDVLNDALEQDYNQMVKNKKKRKK